MLTKTGKDIPTTSGTKTNPKSQKEVQIYIPIELYTQRYYVASQNNHDLIYIFRFPVECWTKIVRKFQRRPGQNLKL